MKSSFLLILLLLFFMETGAQGVAVNNHSKPPDGSAILDLSSTSKGLLIPRLTTTERNSIPMPATALLIFNSDIKQFQVNIGSGSQPNWQNIVSIGSMQPSKEVWLTGGNNGLADTAFFGSSDRKPLTFKTNNVVRLYIDSAHNKVGIGTSLPRTSLDISATDAMIVPVGTTAQRPETPVAGMIRFNATTNKLEGYTHSGWVALH